MDDQEFINQLAEKLSKLGTVRPLGFHYLHPYGTVPADSIICNGATYSRALYKDFFDYITTQGWVKTEAEWQKIATRDNGFCPFYSSGDGSTNFRTPKFAPFMQIAIASSNVGNYHEAGLPDIYGSFSSASFFSNLGRISASGAFYASDLGNANYSGGGGSSNSLATYNYKASRYNAIYGNSTTVQPESNEWMICVVVMGVATNVGSADVGNVMSAVAQVQAELPNKLNTTTPHIVDTWKSGKSWYRKWSDGWVEQGGEFIVSNSYKPITLITPFSKGQYSVFATSYDTNQVYTCATRNHELTSFEMKSSGSPSMRWMAVGY